MSQVSNSLQADQFSRNANTTVPITAGLVLDFDAMKITGLADGAMVASWTDTVNSLSATQASDAKKPVYKAAVINNKPAVRFSSASAQVLNVSNNAVFNLTQGTFFAVAANNGNAGNPWLLYRTGAYAFGSSSRSLRLTAVGVADFNAPLATVWADNTPVIVSGAYDGAVRPTFTVTGMYYGQTAAGTISAFTQNSNVLGIGGGGTGFWEGDIAEILVYNRALTALEVAQVNAYLGAKWGFVTPILDPRLVSTTHAAAPLITPTYDGSGEIVHPSIVMAPNGTSWNGHKFWMSMTPFPNGDASKENPSILVSEDGLTWNVPAGLTNPVVATPGGGTYNSDSELCYSSDGNTLYMFYRTYNISTLVERIYGTSSTDGVTWTTPVMLLNQTVTGSATNFDYLSPAVVWNGSQYVMWTLGAHSYYRTATDPLGTWSAPTAYNLAVSHLDVVYKNGCYYAILWWSGVGLQFTMSKTVNLFSTPKTILTTGTTGTWDDHDNLYRSTILPLNDGWHLWYTGIHYNSGTGKDEWHIGHSKLLGL